MYLIIEPSSFTVLKAQPTIQHNHYHSRQRLWLTGILCNRMSCQRNACNMGSSGRGLGAAPMRDASEPPICDHVELRSSQACQGLPTYALYWLNR